MTLYLEYALANCVLGPFPLAAEDILVRFRERFIQEMDAAAITMELVHHDIITDGDQSEVTSKSDKMQQNQFLHTLLRDKCTTEALMTVCDLVIAVRGNPRMKRFGEDLKRALEAGVCLSACVSMCVCTCACPGMTVSIFPCVSACVCPEVSVCHCVCVCMRACV